MAEAKEDTLRLEAQNSAATQNPSQPRITKCDKQVASVLDVVRPLEWRVQDGHPVERKIKSREAISAALLYRRGQEVKRCAVCQTKGPFAKCVISPSLGGHALHKASCSNCIFYHKGTYCEHRLKFEDSGGDMWREADTEQVLLTGGLRQTLQLMGKDGVEFLRRNGDESSSSDGQKPGGASEPNETTPAPNEGDNLQTGATPNASQIQPTSAQMMTWSIDPAANHPPANEAVSQGSWGEPDTMHPEAVGAWCQASDLQWDDITMPQLSTMQCGQALFPYVPEDAYWEYQLAPVPQEDVGYSTEHEPQKNKQE
ncbi:hypothetical protein AbraIFM66951_004034 [Aspergillus brasiliensis]|uniref:Uncharacterized protein n=1 Tax=Aspergillus brasiliensis TaxID=319629 RepID=A0A9W6DPK4_9EURO|nr:hypothetical protein AbraCBS73388_011007 [Aspergillus brasiliensis]GKZ43305.1 hypothetical protein AbraIFM66951_004034 [Aspergillus brasiliensis]